MLCEKCNQKTATVHMTQIMNNEKTDLYLCDDCASKLGTEGPMSFQDFFKGLIDMAMNIETKGLKKDDELFEYSCKTCGMPYRTFRHMGKLGCADCYETFGAQLSPLLKSIHGSITHTGKIPQKSGAEIIKQKEIKMLKGELAKAISTEEYELAAKLRDKIRSLEKGGESDVLV